MKKILFSAMLFMASLTAFADEGMWMICNLSAKTDSVLKSMGLELSHDEIYSKDHPSLNDAIVQFGGFCSGVVVSNDGLVFTNHHCGYRAIQDHSTPQHDYLKDGFFAKDFEDELPNEDLYVDFHIGTTDVTDQILKYVTPDMDRKQREAVVDSVTKVLTDAIDDPDNGIHSAVVPYYKGSKYYLSIYLKYSDVRLVFAPPSCLGKHGGDTDNWMWPRQTCDFSVFRIYAGKDNKPAEYSKDNVPFHPKRYAVVSTQGYKPGDFCMTFGYPGSTERYLSSYGIDHTVECENIPRITAREAKQEVMKKAMDSSDALRIMYSSKYAESSNYWKNSIGMNKALKDLNVVAEKQATEKEIMDWVAKDAARQAKYATMLDSLKVIYENTKERDYAYTMWEECFYSGSDIMQFAISQFLGVMKEDKPNLKKEVEKAYKDIDMTTDKQLFIVSLKCYKEHVPEQYWPEFYKEIDKEMGGDIEAFADMVYGKTILTKPEELKKKTDLNEYLGTDPMFGVALQAIMQLYAMYGSDEAQEYERLLGDALREMNSDKEYYPDANFTLRMSYGLVGGYTTNEGVRYECFTPSQSIIDKYEKQGNNPDYELTEPVYKWLKKGKFGKKYLDKKDKDMHLCFLTNNDITGGNSGSGMFDGKGRLIGLAFDGNWEAMSGDILFDDNLQRTIGVDIRFVLSVIENYSKGKRLIKELTIE
ncbi:MAG: S46 family peptidase [Bacteroidaceae bacterium]|nr:S46 family peptidase [Bacteroidaceae bacterium]